MKQKNLIIAIALLAFAGAIAFFTPTDAKDTQSATASFNYISHKDSVGDSNVTWDTLGMKTNEQQIHLRIPVDFNRYVFYAYIVEFDSGAGYAFDEDSIQVDLWFETSRNKKDWTQVATLSIVDKATVYSDVRVVTMADGANDTLYHYNWRVLQRVKTWTVSGDLPNTQIDWYDTLTTAFSVEGRNVY